MRTLTAGAAPHPAAISAAAAQRPGEGARAAPERNGRSAQEGVGLRARSPRWGLGLLAAAVACPSLQQARRLYRQQKNLPLRPCNRSPSPEQAWPGSGLQAALLAYGTPVEWQALHPHLAAAAGDQRWARLRQTKPSVHTPAAYEAAWLRCAGPAADCDSAAAAAARRAPSAPPPLLLLPHAEFWGVVEGWGPPQPWPRPCGAQLQPAKASQSWAARGWAGSLKRPQNFTALNCRDARGCKVGIGPQAAGLPACCARSLSSPSC